MLNKVVLVGELVRNVSIKQSNNTNVNSFILATIRIPKDQKRDHEVHFIYCKGFGKAIPNLLDSAREGQMLCVSGQLATMMHTAEDGTREYRMEVWAESVKFMPEKLHNSPNIKNPNELINEAVKNYNRYDFVGEERILTIVNSNSGIADEEELNTTESDKHVEILRSMIKDNEHAEDISNEIDNEEDSKDLEEKAHA
ncbi:single-stranded DNA-binding protein [Lacicoccus qingdaonensis]|uniref:Single-strand DNA-binding protein n=1 Tax=Lacicoccus qingdaonensis TaxID=576118 RepID=A0A1G9I051_9BACL|nr:single-stranded DNA-binding protein [Salinicoccus qingdaonensis]SDL18600.1 single-strand DNA-binding protein [Salinicoccus qingdaonensis]